MPLNVLTGIDSGVTQPIGLRPSVGGSPNTNSQFTRGLRQGVAQVKSAAQGALAAGAGLVGADQFAQDQAQQAQERLQTVTQQNPLRVTKIEDVHSFEDLQDYTIGIVGQQVPVLASLAVGAGAGGLALRAATGISGATAAASGAGAASIGLETGSIFPEILSDPDATGSVQAKAATAIAGGILAGSLDALPAFQIASRLGLGKSLGREVRRSLLSRTAKGAAVTGVTEASTEAVQTVIERATRKFANDNFEILGAEGVSEILNAAVAGGIIGGGLGGFSGAVSPAGSNAAPDISALDDLQAPEEAATSLAVKRINELRGLVPNDQLDALQQQANSFADKDVFDQIDALTPPETVQIRDSRRLRDLNSLVDSQPLSTARTLIDNFKATIDNPDLNLSRNEFSALRRALGNVARTNPDGANSLIAEFLTPDVVSKLTAQGVDLTQIDLSTLTNSSGDSSSLPGSVDTEAATINFNDINTRLSTTGKFETTDTGLQVFPDQSRFDAKGFTGQGSAQAKLTQLEAQFPNSTFEVVPARTLVESILDNRFGPGSKFNVASAVQDATTPFQLSDFPSVEGGTQERKDLAIELARQEFSRRKDTVGPPVSFDKNNPMSVFNDTFAILQHNVPGNIDSRDRLALTTEDLNPGLSEFEKTKRGDALRAAKGNKKETAAVNKRFQDRKLRRDIMRKVKRGGQLRNDSEFFATQTFSDTEIQMGEEAGTKHFQQRGGKLDASVAISAPALTRRMFAKIANEQNSAFDDILNPLQAGRAFFAGMRSLREAGFNLGKVSQDTIILKPPAGSDSGLLVSIRSAQNFERAAQDASLREKSSALDQFINTFSPADQVKNEGFFNGLREQAIKNKGGFTEFDIDQFILNKQDDIAQVGGDFNSPETSIQDETLFPDLQPGENNLLHPTFESLLFPDVRGTSSAGNPVRGNAVANTPQAIAEPALLSPNTNVSKALETEDQAASDRFNQRSIQVGIPTTNRTLSDAQTKTATRETRTFATEDPAVVQARMNKAVRRHAVESKAAREKAAQPQLIKHGTTPDSVRAAAFEALTAEEVRPFSPKEADTRLKAITPTVTLARQVLSEVKDSEFRGFHTQLVREWNKLLGANASVIDVSAAVDFLLEQNDYGRLRGILDGSLHGFSLPDGRVFVNPQLSTSLQTETLAHEMGHAVFKTTVPADFDAVHTEWLTWRNQMDRPGNTVANVNESKQRLRAALDNSYNHTVLTLDSLSDTDRQYVLDFEEWFADQTALWLTQPNTKPTTATEGWFANFIKAVRALFSDLTEGGAVTNAEAAKFLNNKVATLVRRTVTNEAHLDARIKDSRSVDDVVRGKQRDSFAEFVRQGKQDPFGDAAHVAVMRLVTSALNSQEKRILGNAFTQGTVLRQMNKIFKDAPGIQQRMQGSIIQTIAYGYPLWRAGMIDIGPQTQGAFGKIVDAFSSATGFVSNTDQAEQLLDQIQNESFDLERLMSQGSAFELKTVMRDTLLQNFSQGANDIYGKWAKPWMDRLFVASLGRMFETDNPALRQLALLAHTPPNEQGKSSGYLSNKEVQRTQFTDDISRATNNERDPEKLKTIWRSMMLNEDPGTPELRQTVKELHKRLDEIYLYAKRSGLEMKKRKNYFPWVYDREHLQNHKDEFIALLQRPSYKSNLDGIIKNYEDSFQKHQQKIESARRQAEIMGSSLEAQFTKHETNAAAIVDRFGKIDAAGVSEIIYENITDADGYADTEINFDRASHTPFVRALNTRSLNFLLEKGTAQDKEDYLKFFNDNFDYTIRTYIDQVVKRAEFTKSFNAHEDPVTHNTTSDVERLIEEAEQLGASEADIATAHDFINSIQGTHGARTSQLLGKIPLVGETIGSGPDDKLRVINPRLQMAQSWVIVWQNLRVLSMATLTSLADPLGIAVRGGSMDTAMASIKALRKDSRARVVAEKLGIISTYTINEMLGALYSNNFMSAAAQATNEKFFKYTGLSALTRATRVMAVGGALEFLRTHAMGDSALSERFLADLNLEASDVTLDDQSNVQIRNRPQMEALWQQFEKTGDKTVLAEIEREERLRKAINRFVDEAILRPNAATRPIWASDPHFALLFHLKSFIYTFHNQILKRVYNEAALGNYTPVAMLMVYVPFMIAADLLRDIAKFGPAGNPRKNNWSVIDYTSNAVQRAGLPGVSTFLADAKQDRQFGGFGFESFLGPTFQSITQLDNVLLNNGSGSYQAILDQLPLQNTFVVQGLR